MVALYGYSVVNDTIEPTWFRGKNLISVVMDNFTGGINRRPLPLVLCSIMHSTRMILRLNHHPTSCIETMNLPG